jgi:hypothetical protein
MKRNFLPTFTIATTLILLPYALCAQASPSPAQPSANTAAATSEAAQMVPASAKLVDQLDSSKLQPGATFKAVLNQKARLANGTQLPGGTILLGTVTTDDSNIQAHSKLAIQFTSAQLKDGQLIPIKATIVAFYTPADETATVYNGYNYQAPLNDWNGRTLGVDQIGVTSGVDFHSKVTSQNSGVFVAASKADIKVPRGSDFNLAITAQAAQQNSSRDNSTTRTTGN